MTVLEFENRDGEIDSFDTRQLRDNLIYAKQNQVTLDKIDKEELVDICLILIKVIDEHPHS